MKADSSRRMVFGVSLFLTLLLLWVGLRSFGYSWLHLGWGGLSVGVGVFLGALNTRIRGLVSGRLFQMVPFLLSGWAVLSFLLAPYLFAWLVFRFGVDGTSWEIATLITFLISIAPIWMLFLSISFVRAKGVLTPAMEKDAPFF